MLAADAGLTPMTVASARPTLVTETSEMRYSLAEVVIPAAADDRQRRAQSRGVVASTHGRTRLSPKALAIQTKQNGSATARHGAASNFIDKWPRSNRSESRIRREQSRPPV
jgi:hypothetical protein